MFFTLFGAVAVVGVLGAGVMSTMRGPLTTMVEVNRIEETKAEMAVGLRLLLLGAADLDNGSGTGDVLTEPVAPETWAGAPDGAGKIPSTGTAAKQKDAWGTPYAYCAWNNGSSHAAIGSMLAGGTSTNNIAVALISAGPDRKFQTECQAAPTSITPADGGGDDIIRKYNYNDAVAGSDGLWAIQTGAAGDEARVEEEINVGGGAAAVSKFEGGAEFGNNIGVATAGGRVTADVLTPYNAAATSYTETTHGLLIGDSSNCKEGMLRVHAGVLERCKGSNWDEVGKSLWENSGSGGMTTVSGRGHVGIGTAATSDALVVSGSTALTGAFGVTGNSTLVGTLTVSGSNATTLGGTLGVSGATTLSSTLGVTGAAELDASLGVDGTSEFRNDVTAKSDVFIQKVGGAKGNLTVDDKITAVGGDITATAGNVVATAGNVEATAGNVTAGDSVTAQNDITATTGDITASSGNIVATAGNITATAGDIEATAGTVRGAKFNHASDTRDFGAIPDCDADDQKLAWTASGWVCEAIDLNGTGSGTGTTPTLEEVLGYGNDADGSDAEDFRKLGAVEFCDAGLVNCVTSASLVAGSSIWKKDGPGSATGEIYYNGGNVGIGTDDPTYLLDVAGYVRSRSNAPALFLSTANAPVDEKNWLLGTNGSQFVGWISNDANNTAQPWLSVSRTGMNITSTVLPFGNVGIGAAALSPKTKLDIGGTLKIGDGTELCNSVDHEGAMKYDAAADEFYVCRNSATGWEPIGSGSGSGSGGGGSADFSNAVMAFASTSCPAGWSEYTPARGRFLRGIDPSGSTTVDPAGTRAPGSLQDATAIYNSYGSSTIPDNQNAVKNSDGTISASTTGLAVGYSFNTLTRTWDYARPKNVAVIFCKFDGTTIGGSGSGSGGDTEGLYVYGSSTSITTAGVNLAFTTVKANDFGSAWNGTQFTVPAGKAGWYALSAGVGGVSAGEKKLQVAILVNGINVANSREMGSATSYTDRENVSTTYKLAAGDVVKMLASVDTGTVTPETGGETFLSIVRFGGGGGGVGGGGSGMFAGFPDAVTCTVTGGAGTGTKHAFISFQGGWYRLIDADYTYSVSFASTSSVAAFSSGNSGYMSAVDCTGKTISQLTSSGNTFYFGGGGTDTLAGLSCTSGQVAAWNGTAWACANGGSGGGGFNYVESVETTATTGIQKWSHGLGARPALFGVDLVFTADVTLSGRLYKTGERVRAQGYFANNSAVTISADATDVIITSANKFLVSGTAGDHPQATNYKLIFWAGSTGSGGGDTLAGLSCSTGQVAAWNGTGWACAANGSGGGSGFTCPAGFRKLENAGQTLGCIQIAEQGSGTLATASTACYTAFGGRLPSFSEIKTGFDNYALTDETDDREWIDGATADGVGAAISTSGQPEGYGYSSSGAYRCFIPAGGNGGGGSDTLAGLSCMTGQVAAWNGTAWACSTPASGGGGGVVDFVEVATNGMQQNLANNGRFNTVILYQGSGTSISHNTSTGQLTLRSGRTYLINAGVYIDGLTSPAGSVLGFSLYNVTASSTLADAGEAQASNNTGGWSSLPSIAKIFRPSVDTVIELRASGTITSGVDARATISVATLDNGGSDTLAGLTCTTGQVAGWNGTVWACSTPGSGGGAGSSMVPNFPDAISCSGGGSTILFDLYASGSSTTTYLLRGDTAYNYRPSLSYASATGALTSLDNGSGGWASEMASCSGKTIAQLFADGQAFNFVGGGSGGSLWSDSGNGYLEYTGADKGVKINKMSGLPNPDVPLASGLVWDADTNTLQVDGNIEITGELTDASDIRLKEDVRGLGERGSMLDRIKAVEAVSFRMKDSKEGRTEFGVIAQQLEKVFPELVVTDDSKDGFKSVNYTGLIAPLIGAAQELESRNAALRIENEVLRGEVSDLRRSVESDMASVDDLKKQVALLSKIAGASSHKAGSDSLVILFMLFGGVIFGILIIVPHWRSMRKK